ncbi:MAG: acyl-CoA thioesterase [Spirochaetia bacterium]
MSEEAFSVEYRVKWDDLDPNMHLRGAVLVDYAVNTQFALLEHLGFKHARLAELGYDPIMIRMEARYHHEATYNEVIKDFPVILAASPDWSRWKIRHSYTKNDGEKVGRVVLEGTWLNWKTRQAVAPSADVAEALSRLPRATGFEDLKPLIGAENG